MAPSRSQVHFNSAFAALSPILCEQLHSSPSEPIAVPEAADRRPVDVGLIGSKLNEIADPGTAGAQRKQNEWQNAARCRTDRTKESARSRNALPSLDITAMTIFSHPRDLARHIANSGIQMYTALSM